MTFIVSGTTHSNIVRLANQVVADYLQCSVADVEKLADIEIEVEQKTPVGSVPDGYLENYSGKVFAKIK
jgi:hypothetical protein